MKPVFYIGNLPITGDLILAPMDGITDQPFRALARRMGSAMSYTEFISAIDLINGNFRIPRLIDYKEEERPLVYQIIDNDPDRILQAALYLRKKNPDAIDINMGCSARTVSGRGAGVGLMRDPLKIARIFNSLSRALDIPVTGKMRLGWDEDSRNYLEIARIIQENGGQCLAIHGRTKRQGFSGQVDWDAIAEVKQTLSIPVIGGGDIKTLADIEHIKNYTGCDALMIGRAAIGNPWLFARRKRSQIPPEEVFSVMQDHLNNMLAFYIKHGCQDGLTRFRKFAKGYLMPEGQSSQHLADPEQLNHLLKISDPDQFLIILKEILTKNGKG
jgi:tRNA-dihydrouridine synthase B